jgi:PAS domain S-box-containing protein
MSAADESNLPAEPAAFLHALLQSAPVGALVTDTEGRIIYVNRPFEEMTGFSFEEVRGKLGFEVLLPEERWEEMRTRIGKRLQGESSNYKAELFTRSGRRKWFHVHATPFRDADGVIRGTIGVHFDIDAQERLEETYDYLSGELDRERGCDLIGNSPGLRRVKEQIRAVAASDASVLILGETGSGKEVVARAIHESSARRERPLIRVNCAAIPESLFESEFFGHVRGAFSGAVKDRRGKFELADGGTLFLDEVGEIPIALQGKLLRALQEREIERVGDERTRTVDVRVLSATNRDLGEATLKGTFREDLFYRLGVYPIELPPLRDRGEDILRLAKHFIEKLCRDRGEPPKELRESEAAQLLAYPWPGNVRELHNVLERAIILSPGATLHLPRLTPRGKSPAAPAPPACADALTLADLPRLERDILIRYLEASDWKLSGKGGAAGKLGIPLTTLASKMKRLGIRKRYGVE